MIIGIIAQGARAAAAGGFESVPLGALLTATAGDHAIGSSIAAITDYSVTVFDALGWEQSNDNTTLGVPSHADVQLIRFLASLYTDTDTFHGLRLDTGGGYAGFDGGGQSKGDTGGNTLTHLMSSIQVATAGDLYQHWLETAAATNQQDEAAHNWFGVEVVPPGTRYTLVRKNATQSISASTLTSITWGTELVDTLGSWTSGTDFVVPGDTTGKLRVSAGGQTNSYTGAFALFVYLNGAQICNHEYGPSTSTVKISQVASRIIDVVPTDVITVRTITGGAATLSNNGNVWACVEEIPADHRYCVAVKSASQAITSGNSADVQWDGADLHDPEGLHDPSSSNTIINVPGDATEYRCSSALYDDSSTGTFACYVTIDGNREAGHFSGEVQTTGQDALAGMGLWVPVGGSQLELRCLCPDANKSVTAGYFQVEFR